MNISPHNNDCSMKRATKFEILRGVTSTSRKPCIAQPSATPVRVAFLLDEAAFLASGGLMEHHRTVFLEDANHDWCMRDGVFYYFGRAIGLEEAGDIVVVLEQEEVALPAAAKKAHIPQHPSAKAESHHE